LSAWPRSGQAVAEGLQLYDFAVLVLSLSRHHYSECSANEYSHVGWGLELCGVVAQNGVFKATTTGRSGLDRPFS
jgi:hypothetical protein